MSIDTLANFVRDSVDASIGDTDTEISVADASIFPDPATNGEYNAVVWDVDAHPRPDQDPDVEIVRVTAVDTTGDELTVSRGQEDTTAVSHPSGAAIHVSVTAKMFDDVAGALDGKQDEVTTVDPTEAVADEEPSADDSDADNPLAIAVAGNALANDDDAVGIGNGATASGNSSTALGRDATASDFAATALGYDAEASDLRATALGQNATASDFAATALGQNATASDSRATALGLDATASGDNATALGRGATASGSESTALGRDAEALNSDAGTIGVSTGDFGTSDWTVPGDFTVQGSKDFEIDHPSDPETRDLRHGAYEGPVPGGLIYNATVTADGERVDLAGHLPEYVTNDDFGTDWTCHVTASDHFGRGYVNADEWMLIVEEPGDYEVTIFGERDDDAATNNGKHRTEKPKGERWNGDPRTYWRDCPHADAANHDGVERVESKFEHTPECSPEPCEEAHVMCRVTFDDGERVEVEDAEYEEACDEIVRRAKEMRSETK